jgi:anthranilate 1,2-dioxygenase small subunit
MNDILKTPGVAADFALTARVERLITDYVTTIDEERYADLPDFFAEDGLYQVISKENHKRKRPFGLIYCDSRAMLRDRIMSMHKANIYEPHVYRHVTGRSTVTVGADGVLEAKTAYIVARIMHDGRQDLFSTGVYQDRIVENAGVLQFAHKIVVTDSSRVDALLVIPL